ncbi:hypothetical protein VX159_14940 [Dechloromonas sp. ZY10]|uniref:hypothetical protein n=1 Tax=Dechloromonas aquae TaxID=2664436 RepID=UPI00352951AC
MPSTVGALGLECLMNRANIYFTSGYRFAGPLDTDALCASYNALLDATEKFSQRLHFSAQTDYQWRPAPQHRHFRVIDSNDIERDFAELCRQSLELSDEEKHSAMALTVLRQNGSNEFIIAQTCEHTYVDARSAECLFNRLIEHYNAGLRRDQPRQQAVLSAAATTRTAALEEMLPLLDLDEPTHQRNLAGLGTYPVADDGAYAIPLAAVPGHLGEYRKQRFAPVSRHLPLAALVERCRRHNPEVTRNSVICAALAKGFYEQNRREKQLPEKQTISFKMLSDLLPPDVRERYCGNYIAFVPVSVDGELPIEQIAEQIHRRIREFKDQKIDASLFRAVEDAVRQGVVGTSDDALSFVVTNWNNYRFLQQPDFLHGCTSLRHQSGVNISPRDTLGAVLVNRPILVINESPRDEVCLSFFPSLRAEAENIALANRIAAHFV